MTPTFDYNIHCSFMNEQFLTNTCSAFLENLDNKQSTLSQFSSNQRIHAPLSSDVKKMPQKREFPYNAYRDLSEEVGPKRNTNRRAMKFTFPAKLMNILSDTSIEHIISWCPHGRAFIVKNSYLFGKFILPLHFQTNKYSSFRKQLSLWNFQRITEGPDAGSYFHESFLRTKTELLTNMKYKKIKGSALKNYTSHPNFYRLPALPALPSNENTMYHQSNENICKLQSKTEFLCTTTKSEQRKIITDSKENESRDSEEQEISQEECRDVLSRMVFPGPFTAPPIAIFGI